jgi:hypothetical protein
MTKFNAGDFISKSHKSRAVSSHELARILLANEDLPIAVHVSGHTYSSKADAVSHGPLEIGILRHYAGRHIVIGNMLECIQDAGNMKMEIIITHEEER